MADKTVELQASAAAEPAVLPIGRISTPIRYVPEKQEEIEYPETDGKPMAETERHRDGIIRALQMLPRHFVKVPDICISGNMMLYYMEDDKSRFVSPDVFVVFGVERRERRLYRTWEEGKPPDFVLEFSSKGTFKRDLNQKKDLYALMGVREYFLYDVDGLYLPTPLIGYHFLDDNQLHYARMPVGSDGSILSSVLNLELHDLDGELGFYDPVAGEWLKTDAEAAEARAAQEAASRHQAETRAEQAETRAEQAETRAGNAEAENAQLRAEIERLKARNAEPQENS